MAESLDYSPTSWHFKLTQGHSITAVGIQTRKLIFLQCARVFVGI